MANLITVGISDAQISSDINSTLVTYALGSCIGVSLHDPLAKIGGLLHFMLPESSMDTERGRNNPYMYADTGIPEMVQKLIERGANKHRMVVRVAGGAQVFDDHGIFNIGKRNHISMRKAIWKAGMFIHAEAVGGSLSRTVWLEVGSGRFLVREGGTPPQELVPARSQGGK